MVTELALLELSSQQRRYEAMCYYPLGSIRIEDGREEKKAHRWRHQEPP